MPKPTFFRLPEEKRLRLIKAAYAEFTRAPFNEASISNIIKDAGIPRGSFYQYFEDKGDVFFYLLDRLGENLDSWVQGTTAKYDGDFFAAIATVFDRMIDELVNGQYAAFYRNVFMYMDLHSMGKMTPPANHPKPNHKHTLTQFLLENIDRDKLQVSSDEDVRMLIVHVLGIFMQTVGYYYNHLKRDEEVSVQTLKLRLAKLLEWTQFGVAKEATTHD